MKRIFTLLIVLALVLCAMPVQAAEGGSWGENITWRFDGETLTISGSGKMDDCTAGAPWHQYKDQVKRIVFTGSITYIGADAFADFDQLTEIYFAEDLYEIGARAFKGCDGLVDLIMPKSFKILGEECFRGCKNLESLTCLGRFPSFRLNCLWDVYVNIYYLEKSWWPQEEIDNLENAFHGRIQFEHFEGAAPALPTMPPETTPAPTTPEPTTPPPTTPEPTTPAPTTPEATRPILIAPTPTTTPEPTTTPAPTTPAPTVKQQEILDTREKAWTGVAIILGILSGGGLLAASVSLYKNKQRKNSRRG